MISFSFRANLIPLKILIRTSENAYSRKKGFFTRALMALLGHDRLTTTELYLNLSPEDAIREFQNKWGTIPNVGAPTLLPSLRKGDFNFPLGALDKKPEGDTMKLTIYEISKI